MSISRNADASRKKSYLLFPLLILLIGFLIPISSPSYCVAQEPAGWYEQDPGTTAMLTAIEAVDPLTAWAVGMEGTILKTENGGEVWLPQESGTTMHLADISAVDGNNAWAVGGDSVGSFIVLKTVDGGETWDNIAEGTGFFLGSIEAVSAEVAWVGGMRIGALGPEGVISKTMDGGGTWYLQPPGITYGIYEIEAIDADTAWAVGGPPTVDSLPAQVMGGEFILKTENGGWTWTTQEPVPVPGWEEPLTFLAVEATDANDVWALGVWEYDVGIVSWLAGRYMKSSDGGATWYMPCAGDYGAFLGLDISAVDTSTAWVVGETSVSGNFSKTSNGGLTWACQASDPVVEIFDMFFDISAASPDVAWALGEDNTVLHTTNGGYTQPAPHIESISPASGKAGSDPLQITITGTNFGAGGGMSSDVVFDMQYALKTDSWSDTEIIASIDETILYSSPPGQYEVTVTTPGGTSNAVIFTILEGLEVHLIQPASGIQYTLSMDCNLLGVDFKPGAAVRIENGSASVGASYVNVLSHSHIAFRISLLGAPPGVYDVVVTNPDGSQARLEDGFTVTPLCGSGSGAALLMFGLSMGLLSLAGSTRLFRRKK